MREPKLRSVEKHKPPYPLNKFPAAFAESIAMQIVVNLYAVGESIEGAQWEEMFAKAIGAEWKPSNVGLDDIVLQQTAWGAKTVKNAKPLRADRVRLISGRNSLDYSFNQSDSRSQPPGDVGEQVLSIWNERVAGIKKRYQHLRTVVLLKGPRLREIGIFESETLQYNAKDFNWNWNSRKNLEGCRRSDDTHIFTWQPHGSQFTIIEDVPPSILGIKILRQPPKMDAKKMLEVIGYDKSWVKIFST